MSRGLRYRFRPRAVWIAVLATVAVLTGSALLPGGIAQAGSPGWKSLAPMIQTRYGEVAGTLSNGQIIVAGGVSWSSGSPQWLTEAELYNPTSNTWSPTRSMSDPTSSAGSAVATNGLFYVSGGGDGSVFFAADLQPVPSVLVRRPVDAGVGRVRRRRGTFRRGHHGYRGTHIGGDRVDSSRGLRSNIFYLVSLGSATGCVPVRRNCNGSKR